VHEALAKPETSVRHAHQGEVPIVISWMFEEAGGNDDDGSGPGETRPAASLT
jgi:hypothetical protein